VPVKFVKLPNYNMVFNPANGFLARWGNTPEEDPVMCSVGPEILDIEISTICHGVSNKIDDPSCKPCAFCYKSNTGIGENMSLETFKTVINKFPKVLTQVALGIGDLDGNPDLISIMEYCRKIGIVPNLTINGYGLTDEWAVKLSNLCGAVAVSHYGNDLCFNAVKKLTDAGLTQTNIHKLLSKETYKSCFDLIDKVVFDPRTKGLKAIVFLLLKPKGNRNHFHSIVNLEDYKKLLDYAKEKGVQVGMDSCSAPMALRSLPSETIPSIEPCESTLFSLYINTEAEAFPCSFTEGEPGWETGINMLEVEDFLKDVWMSPRLDEWRQGLLKSSDGCGGCSVKQHCRSCPVFDSITVCKKELICI